MKKLVSILLSLILVISAIPNVLAADDSKNVRKREVLNALGIMSIEGDSEFVTRKEFFTGLLHMVYDSVDETQVQELLVKRGILFDNSDTLFAEDNYIIYNDAIASVVDILGYEPIAQTNGGYPEGYIKAAQQIGILSGVTGSRTLSIERNSLANLLFNAIETEPFVHTFAGQDVIGEVANDKTILSMERNIYEVQGVVEANQYTSLMEEKGNSEDQVTVNGKNYYINGTNAGDLLGYSVKGYVQFNEDEDEDGNIIFMSINESRIKELVIKPEDVVSVTSDCRKIEYYPEGKRTSKTLKISPTVRVFYNGIFYDQYTCDDFIVDNGNLKLVDNNTDGVYDCIFITSLETMVVAYTTVDNEIYGKYNYQNSLNYLKLEDSLDNANTHYYLGNDEVAFSKILKNDVLTIQRNKSGSENYVKVYISRNIIAGHASRFDDDQRTIKIDGEEYRVTKAFCNEADHSEISLASNYNFYFDYFGEVAYFELKSDSEYNLFYKIKQAYEDYDYEIKYMNENSEWITAPVAKRVIYNDVTYSSDVLYRELESAKPQIMLIKQNTKGEVKYITTASLGTKGDRALTKTLEKQMHYHNTPQAFDYSLYLETTAKVFVIPTWSNPDLDDFYVTTRGYFKSNRDYTVTAYDVDEFNFTNIISVSESETSRQGYLGGNMLVVTDSYYGLNEYNDAARIIKCSRGAYHNLEYEVSEFADSDDIERGSIIRVSIDKKNGKEIVNWINVSDALNTLADSRSDDLYLYCTVLNMDSNGGKLKISCDGTEGFFRVTNAATVLIYNASENTCVAGSYKDIKPKDKMYLYTYYAVPQEIVIVRD